MSGKNQSAQKRQQAKQHKRKTAIRQKEHRAQEAVNKRKREANALKDTQLSYRIATQGVIATAEQLRKEGYNGKTAKKMTNLGVIKGIHQMIPVFATLHGATEIVSDLVLEKRFELTTDQVDLMTNFDRAIVSIIEDINAIYDFIDAGKKPTDYMELYVHYIDTLADVCQIQQHELLENLLRPNKEAIDQYIKEHAGEGAAALEEYSMQKHNIRMERVAPLYRTKATELEDMTAPLADPQGDLVDEDDVDADVALEMAKEIAQDPLSC